MQLQLTFMLSNESLESYIMRS